MHRESFASKLNSTRNLIKRLLSEHEKPVVACSFGKNSMVVLHLVYQFNPNVNVLFNDTLVEYPDTYEFKKIITPNWNINLIQTKPIKTFWWIVKNYGFPLYSRKGYQDASKYCCLYLKEYPIEKVLRTHNFDLYFTGLSRHESRLREFSAKKYGNYFYSKRHKHWKCHPIQDWTDDDVWKYHEIYNLPHNSLYDKKAPDGFIVRTGCWCCTIPIRFGKIEFLRKNYPHLWRLLIKKGLGRLILEKKVGINLDNGQIEHLMETRPCFFDKC